MKQIFKDVKSMRKILQNKDFYFIITVYPIGALIFAYALNVLKTRQVMTEETQNLYSLWTMLGCSFYVIYSVYELFDKKLLYKNQGDKLKLKEGEKDWKTPTKKSK